MSTYRLLKFDVIHPDTWLRDKQDQWDDLDALSRADYLDRLNRLRSNYSDYYTHYLDDVWTAEEFYLNDPVYLEKVARELYGPAYWWKRITRGVARRLQPGRPSWRDAVVHDYVQAFDPDVIFARSQPIPSAFWQRYRDDTLLVARLSARMPKRWHPEHFDVLFTDVPLFQEFFERHDVPTYLNDQGFDPRVLEELDDRPPKYDVTFVGGLGSKNFQRRTELFETIAGEVDAFRWWGYWWPYGDDLLPMSAFPNLEATFQGPTSGLEMYQIYHDSRIALNDYVDTAGGLGVNQRMYEVLGVGAFLLTRDAPNFEDDFPGELFGTFSSTEECIDKVHYYLDHPDERAEMAQRGQAFVIENFHYRDIVEEFDDILRDHLDDG
jgi:hypothetical protein